MDWEVINGVTGIVSAVGAFSGIRFVAFGKEENSSNVFGKKKLASFTIASSGWALCCLTFLWVMEPYGPFVTDRDYQQFFGIILAFPAIVILLFGINLMQAESGDKSIKNDTKEDTSF